jgi:hypothetical protein
MARRAVLGLGLLLTRRECRAVIITVVAGCVCRLGRAVHVGHATLAVGDDGIHRIVAAFVSRPATRLIAVVVVQTRVFITS